MKVSKLPVSVLINTLNAASTLKSAVDSVKQHVSQVVVVDMHSEDQTVDLAKKLGAQVYLHARRTHVEPARNFGLKKCSQPWILILDADEEVPDSLWPALEQIIKQQSVDVVKLPRLNFIWGKKIKHTGFWPDYNVRFFRAGKVQWQDQIHSQPLVSGRQHQLPPAEKYALIHHHYKNLDQFITRMLRYTQVQAQELNQVGYQFSWQDLFNRPLAEFWRRFYFHQGWKDGVHGLALSGLQAVSELLVYLRLWEMQGLPAQTIKPDQITAVTQQNLADGWYWRNSLQSGRGRRLWGAVVEKLIRYL